MVGVDACSQYLTFFIFWFAFSSKRKLKLTVHRYHFEISNFQFSFHLLYSITSFLLSLQRNLPLIDANEDTRKIIISRENVRVRARRRTLCSIAYFNFFRNSYSQPRFGLQCKTSFSLPLVSSFCHRSDSLTKRHIQNRFASPL